MNKQAIYTYINDHLDDFNKIETTEFMLRCFNDLQGWVSVESITLNEGERWLCRFNGEPIVLELGRECPTHEESFKPFFYWFEPYGEMMDIEWHEVTDVKSLPPNDGE